MDQFTHTSHFVNGLSFVIFMKGFALEEVSLTLFLLPDHPSVSENTHTHTCISIYTVYTLYTVYIYIYVTLHLIIFLVVVSSWMLNGYMQI